VSSYVGARYEVHYSHPDGLDGAVFAGEAADQTSSIRETSEGRAN